MRVCDGCGAAADEAHIRQRIERLELATRFRPIHIQVLLVGDAPAALDEDYFYRVHREGPRRSPEATEYFLDLLAAAGIEREAGCEEESALAEFQHRGFYLADALECPAAPASDLKTCIVGAARTIEKRIQFSYRPKHVVLMGAAARELEGIFQKSTFADRLVNTGGAGKPGEARRATGAEIAAALGRVS